MANEQNSNKARLDEAVQRLKQQMSSDKQKDDWKKAYLNGIAFHKQSLNRSTECLN